MFRDAEGTHASDTCIPVHEAIERGDIELHAVARSPYPGTRCLGNALPGLKTVGFWDARGRQQWGLDWHRNDGIEITYVRSGTCVLDPGSGPVTLTHRRVAVTQPWQRHRLGDPCVRSSRLGWIILDVGVHRPNQRWRWPEWVLLSAGERASIERALRTGGRNVWDVSGDLRSAFDLLFRGLRVLDDQPISKERLQLLVGQVFAALADVVSDERGGAAGEWRPDSERTVRVFLDELPRHADHPWTVAEMAAACGLGVSRFTTVCRELTNRSPIDLLGHLRVSMAAEMLRKRPDLSVTQIAMRCGFGSSQYFSHCFRKRIHETPSHYRESDRHAM